MTELTHPSCGKTWKQRGNITGHCAQCHETFDGVALFDAHLRLVNGHAEHLDPRTITLGKDKYKLRLVDGIWRGREMPKGTFGPPSDTP